MFELFAAAPAPAAESSATGIDLSTITDLFANPGGFIGIAVALVIVVAIIRDHDNQEEEEENRRRFGRRRYHDDYDD